MRGLGVSGDFGELGQGGGWLSGGFERSSLKFVFVPAAAKSPCSMTKLTSVGNEFGSIGREVRSW